MLLKPNQLFTFTAEAKPEPTKLQMFLEPIQEEGTNKPSITNKGMNSKEAIQEMMKKQAEAARLSSRQALKEHKKKRLTYKERNFQSLNKLSYNKKFAQTMVGSEDKSFRFKEEEDQYAYDIMHQVIPSEDFNVHILLKTLNEAMQKKNRAAIDLLIN